MRQQILSEFIDYWRDVVEPSRERHDNKQTWLVVRVWESSGSRVVSDVSECWWHRRLFEDEVERSSHLNQLLGVGIGLFQGLSNIALNGMCVCLSGSLTVSVCVCFFSLAASVSVSWVLRYVWWSTNAYTSPLHHTSRITPVSAFSTPRHLQSADLDDPVTAASPSLWNSLPSELKKTSLTVGQFSSRLKTEMF